MTDTLTGAEERRVLAQIKKAVDLVDNDGLSPDEAIAKVASDERAAPGMIGMLCRSYNTGRQLGQWRANTSILDKLAGFPLADPDRVTALVYPPAETPKQAMLKRGFDEEYSLPPSWLPDERVLAAQRRELSPTTKQASPGCTHCGKEKCTCEYKSSSDDWRMRQALGWQEKARHAHEEARRHEAATRDQLTGKVAGLVSYFKQASYNRLPFAQVEHAARVYLGPAAVDLLKLAYERARLKEPRAGKISLQKTAFDLEGEPFTLIQACIKLAEDVLTAARWTGEARELMREVEANSLRPFGRADVPAASRTASQSPPSSHASEKVAFGAVATSAAGNTLGNMATTVLGDYPQSKSDLVDKEWMELESPDHQNELRKIRTHAMLNSLLTDPDDPISGSDPDKVLSAYNEIAQTAPRAAYNSAILKPLLRKRLSGLTEPFEAKELVDIEKGLRDTRNVPPSNLALGQAPDGLLG